MFLQRLAKAAREKCKLSQEPPILLGVSGGADSLAMMLGLNALGFNLIIAHVDHGLRPESHTEADFVCALAELYGLPCVVQKIDVRKVAEAEQQSIEEAARHVRYRFLFDQARRHQCQAVAVAHHADDQVETVLMHFLRGSALPGLTGMPYRRIMPSWHPEIPLVRPLLGFWRDEIEAYIESLGVEPCVDLSNLDTRYYRNRIRHALIPELETYNPQIRQVIWRMADVLDAEAQFLDKLTGKAYQKCLVSECDDCIMLNMPKFLDLPIALKRRVLRAAIEQLRPELRDVGFDAIARGVSFAETPNASGEIDLVARLNLAVLDDVLVIKTWEADLPDFGKPLLPDSQFEVRLVLDNPITLKHGYRLEARLVETPPQDLLKAVKHIDPNEAWLDYDQLDLPLMVRGNKEGESFQPLGMGGQTQSLQDFYVNLKIPAHLRSVWPLVVSDQTVVWVVGLRPSELFKITKNTRRVYVIKLVRNGD